MNSQNSINRAKAANMANMPNIFFRQKPGLFDANTYISPLKKPGFFARYFPSAYFYRHMAQIVYVSSRSAMQGKYNDADWVASSLAIAGLVEDTGGRLVLEGLDIIRDIKEPCLFVGNHMSTLETFILPGIIQPLKPIAFVVKQSLTSYPFFGAVMRARNPIVVGRNNPREDLLAVLEGGFKRLEQGISLVIFPQSTRMEKFEPEKFNSIGIKLAKKAGVLLVPFALKTTFWGNGRIIKDFGPIRPQDTVHIRFGEALKISGNGKAEQEQVLEFIGQSLAEWQN